jgi:hypothetical protein
MPSTSGADVLGKWNVIYCRISQIFLFFIVPILAIAALLQ